jgi:hypothetical protein
MAVVADVGYGLDLINCEITANAGVPLGHMLEPESD